MVFLKLVWGLGVFKALKKVEWIPVEDLLFSAFVCLSFDPWFLRWQNSLHTAWRSYSSPGGFYPNIRLGIGLLKASHKSFHIAGELKEEQEV